MKCSLSLIIFVHLFQYIHLQECQLAGNNLICRNLRLERGDHLDFKGNNENVTIINHYDCNIEVVSVGVYSTFQNVEQIWLQYSNVRTIEPGAFSDLNSLKLLVLFNNVLTQIPDDIKFLSNLEELNAARNKISDLPPGVFGSLNNLVNLYLDTNNINEIKRGVLDSLIYLKRINLAANGLTKIPDDIKFLPNLEVFDIANNTISDYQPGVFSSWNNLVEISLHGNNINEIKRGVLDSNINLKRIYIQNNALTKIPDDIKFLSKLELLELYHNKLRDVPKHIFANLTKLKYLSLSFNLISHLDADSFVNLQSLVELHLQYNNLINLDCQLFRTLNNLEILNLSYNKLTILPQNCFRASNKLREFYIDNNELVSFDAAFFLFLHPRLTKISLNGNSWNCNELKKSAEVLRQYDSKITDKGTKNSENVNGITCSSIEYENRKYSDLFEESRRFVVFY